MARGRADGAPSRLGLFGGTFDPPHVGHLAAAEWARETLALDRVVFIPCGRPPHKTGRALSPAAERLAMTRLAVRGNAAFTVADLEVRRAGPSYTIDTVRAFRRRHPRAHLFLIIGADSLDEFATWREPEAIAAATTLAVAGRPGAKASAQPSGGRSRRATGSDAASRPDRQGLERPRIVWIGNPDLDISATVLRRRVRARRSIRYLVPAPVERYIERRRLYRR